MPKENGVGYSHITPVKIKNLGSIFAMHQQITQAVIEKHPSYSRTYHYIDLTSGRGFSPDGTHGSPLVFWEKAQNLRIPYQADFIERNEQNISELERVLIEQGCEGKNLKYHLGDYRVKIHEILKPTRQNELGLSFIDPSGNLPDFETLRYIAEIRPRMEILIYLSSTVVKRLTQYTKKFLADYISNIPKSKWLISTPVKGDKFKWVFLLGSSSDIFKNYHKIGFYRLDSEKGEDLFERVNMTKEERKKILQPRLFE